MNQLAQAPPAQSSCASSLNTNTTMFNEPLVWSASRMAN